MKVLTGKEIIDILEDNITTSDFAYEEFDSFSEELELGKCELISSQEGDIGNTSYAHRVFFFEDHNVHIKLNGWYSSYSGRCEWDEDAEYSVVEPKEKVITIWE
tara:strand:- start:1299 stop:1610 length:312 start_codon:yes stop_codon:yes gene_type:complete